MVISPTSPSALEDDAVKVERMPTRVVYRGWIIRYDPCVPVPYCDWAFEHDDFDGAPDAQDHRYGYAATLDEAKREIDIREDEEA